MGESGGTGPRGRKWGVMRLTNHHSYSQSTKEVQSPKDRMYLVSVKEHVRRDLGDGPERQPEGAPGGRGALADVSQLSQ